MQRCRLSVSTYVTQSVCRWICRVLWICGRIFRLVEAAFLAAALGTESWSPWSPLERTQGWLMHADVIVCCTSFLENCDMHDFEKQSITFQAPNKWTFFWQVCSWCAGFARFDQCCQPQRLESDALGVCADEAPTDSDTDLRLFLVRRCNVVLSHFDALRSPLFVSSLCRAFGHLIFFSFEGVTKVCSSAHWCCSLSYLRYLFAWRRVWGCHCDQQRPASSGC